MSLQPDQTILNKYHILELIGEGGMARVWLAEELTFGHRRVALKEPRDDLLPEDLQELRRRYDREVKVCAALAQARVPHIVQAHTAEPYDDGRLLVLEYLPGGDLAGLLRQHPQGLPIARAVQIALDVLRALQGAHEHPLEIVHRDVKPSNILFDDQGQAHLGDFGFAQLAGVSQRSQLKGGQHPGTPLYMAPEQATSQDYLTPAADLYALGCVLFEMLTGKRYKRVRPGTPASALRAEVPAWLDQVLAQALAEDPWDRWESAAEMAQALAAEQGRQGDIGTGGRGRKETISPSPPHLVTPSPPHPRPVHRRTPTGLVIVSGPDDLRGLDPLPERILWEPDGKEMVLVPAGPLLMGTPEGEVRRLAKEYGVSEDWFLDETPQREVELEAYYIDKTPVTNAEYKAFVDATGYRPPYHWKNGQIPKGKEDHPVVQVSWHDAVAYCRWAGKQLPTEAQWEKAARGTDGREYPWGNRWDAKRCNTKEGGPGGTTPVGQYPQGASPYGALDMAGNVWEWCADWYQGYPGTASQSKNFGEKYRVLRGGSWYLYRFWARCAYRDWGSPDNRSNRRGFRCCAAATSSL